MMAAFFAWTCAGGPALDAAPLSLPPALRLSVGERTLTTQSGTTVVSTARLCDDRSFEPLGARAPRLSPDEHWILVGVRGPYAPGNVARNHALIQVRSGRVVLAPDFPAVLGIPSTSDVLSWASGELETLRYADGKTVALHDPPLRPLPPQRCAGAQNVSLPRRTVVLRSQRHDDRSSAHGARRFAPAR